MEPDNQNPTPAAGPSLAQPQAAAPPVPAAPQQTPQPAQPQPQAPAPQQAPNVAQQPAQPVQPIAAPGADNAATTGMDTTSTDPLTHSPVGDAGKTIKSPVPTTVIPAVAIGLLILILLLAVAAYAFL